MKTFYCGNISYDATEDELKSFFEFAGFQVSRVKICIDRDTNRSRGFAFVDVTGDTDTVISTIDGQEFIGRPMRIREANPKPTTRRRDQSDTDLL